EWVDNDAFLIIGGVVATIINLLIGFKKQLMLIVSLLSIFFWIFLLRGGVVLQFYVVPLLPFLAMNIGITIIYMLRTLDRLVPLNAVEFGEFILIAIILGWYSYKGGAIFHENLFTSDQTAQQIQAVNWLKQNTIPGSFVVIDDYGYIELHDPHPSSDNYTHAEWYWKVDEDPQIENIIHNDSSNITYIAQTQQMQSDIQISGLKLVGNALSHATVIKQFYKDNYGVTIWATHFPKEVLNLSWNSYKKYFLTPEGASIDPYQHNATTSEGQSYALLRATWLDDKTQFDKTWGWTQKNMQQNNGLFSWYILQSDGITITKKPQSASDADEDIALSLLFAFMRWHNNSYLISAKKIIAGIWKNEVRLVDNQAYLVAGDWAKNQNEIIVNPSYLAPYEYRIFAQVDSHNWNNLLNNSYSILSRCSDATLDTPFSVGLPPNWCSFSNNGNLVSISPTIGDSNYSYDAFRVPFRLALDYVWYKDSRDEQYIREHQFLLQQWGKRKMLFVGYTHDGKVNQNYESAGAYGANIGAFILENKQEANNIYIQKILPKFYTNGDMNYWEDPKNYYVQNWAWFGTALYFDRLQNLWDNGKTDFRMLLDFN
ncbi:MAG: hypothetical protein KGL95_05040, partial [Patescibacteria group bacterium]|nr:hypothetical protein [Patescibacteria group bacterium]